jgi:hypothetical protein
MRSARLTDRVGAEVIKMVTMRTCRRDALAAKYSTMALSVHFLAPATSMEGAIKLPERASASKIRLTVTGQVRTAMDAPKDMLAQAAMRSMSPSLG